MLVTTLDNLLWLCTDIIYMNRQTWMGVSKSDRPKFWEAPHVQLPTKEGSWQGMDDNIGVAIVEECIADVNVLCFCSKWRINDFPFYIPMNDKTSLEEPIIKPSASNIALSAE